MKKKRYIGYWIVTIIFAGFMAFSGIAGVMIPATDPNNVTTAVLHYPAYLPLLLCVAKLLGGIAILVPGFPRLKEWAYAGFAIDLIGAMYSMISVGIPVMNWAPIVIFLILLFVSYFLYHKKVGA